MHWAWKRETIVVLFDDFSIKDDRKLEILYVLEEISLLADLHFRRPVCTH